MAEQSVDVSDIQLFDLQTLKEPYVAYQRLRDHSPVHFVPELGVHVITRYDLLREAIRDTKTFSSRFDSFLGKSQEIMFAAAPPDVQIKLRELAAKMVQIPPTMLTLDEPEHTRYRSLVSRLFTAGQVRQAQPQVQAVIDAAVDTMRGKTAIDFVADFAFPVPLRVIADRLGIPEESRAYFDEAATAAAAALRLSPLTPELMVHRAELALGLQELLINLVEARRSDPREDMITILANSKLDDEDRYLTHGEALSILNQFLVAGHETTASTFGFGMLLLCRNPHVQEQLHANPKAARTFVEEALRLEAPVQGLPRLVTRDTELGGYPLKAGDMVMLRYGAANRDERQFGLPDELNLEREKAGMQMAFGAGVHFCIGAPLARQELTLGFPALLEAFTNFRLDPSKPEPEAEPSFILRNLPNLHVTYEAR